jgi:WD40 repeat protein
MLQNDYVVKTLTGHTEAVMSVKIHGNDVFSGSCDGTVKMYHTRHDTRAHDTTNDTHGICDRWNAFTAKCTATLSGHTGWVNCLHLDHEKERLVSGSYDKFLKLYAPSLCLVRVGGRVVLRVRCACCADQSRTTRTAHPGGICIGRARSGR